MIVIEFLIAAILILAVPAYFIGGVILGGKVKPEKSQGAGNDPWTGAGTSM